jgi:hypothetical protein
MVILYNGIIRCEVYQKIGFLFVPFIYFHHLSRMCSGKGSKDCTPCTTQLSHSPHLEDISCASHSEIQELP